MQRGPLFLAAAFCEVLRFFCLMLFAVATGLMESGPLVPAFLRYLGAAQLLLVAVFYFLWQDEAKYAAYRPLAILGKALSLLAFVPLLLGFLAALRGSGFIPLPAFALVSAFFIAMDDVFGLLVIALYRRRGGPLADPVPAQAVGAGADGQQRGPADIEGVEALP